MRTNLQQLGVLSIALFLPILVRAQLVADGQSNVLSGVVSNISEAVTVGTNGSFTLLVLTNGSALSNTTGDVTIGLNSSAQSNRLIVTGSQWFVFGGMEVGSNGSGNELDIRNGGIVSGGGQYGGIGYGSSANSNLALVSDSGSIWTNLSFLGYSGSFNTLVISNGGQVFGGGYGDFEGKYAFVGGNSSSLGNSAIVTGPGSLWVSSYNQSDFFYLGYYGSSSNQLLVTDSGTFIGGTLIVGLDTQYNQLTVSNSGIVTVSYLGVGGEGNSLGNSITIDGGIVKGPYAVTVYPSNTLTLNSGLLTVSELDVPDGQFIFNGGTLQSILASFEGNPLVVGDGTNAALYTMLGATHRFPGLIISSNAVLNGSGTILGVGTNFANVSVNNGGTIAPGTNNPGTIAIDGALTLNAGSTILMKLNASDSTSDTFTGMSNIVYGGTLQLTDVSGSYSAGQSFSLFGATNYTGAFAALMPASPGPGLRWDTNELSVDGVLRVFTTTTPTPVIGSVAAANGNLLISASGGIPYNPCYLLASTNLAVPVSDWSCVATNYFDSTGATTFTNAIPTEPVQQYFRLQVN